jgi:DNA-binding response OmpR family regulator
VRLTKRISTAPVLMMTGVPSEAAVLQEMNVGADDVLIKPFDVSDHMSRVTKLLKEHPGCKLRQSQRPAGQPVAAGAAAACTHGPEPHVALESTRNISCLLQINLWRLTGLRSDQTTTNFRYPQTPSSLRPQYWRELETTNDLVVKSAYFRPLTDESNTRRQVSSTSLDL